MNAKNRTTIAPRPGGRATARGAGRQADEHRVEGNLAVAPQQAEQRPHQLRVAPPAPITGPRAPFIALILVLVVGGLLGILLLNTKINENAFLLDDLHRKQTGLDVREQQLNRELAELASAGNLEAQAKRLGLVDSGEPAWLRLPDGQVIGVPKPATGVPSVTSQTASGR